MIHEINDYISKRVVVCPTCGHNYKSEKFLQKHINLKHHPNDAYSPYSMRTEVWIYSPYTLRIWEIYSPYSQRVRRIYSSYSQRVWRIYPNLCSHRIRRIYTGPPVLAPDMSEYLPTSAAYYRLSVVLLLHRCMSTSSIHLYM